MKTIGLIGGMSWESTSVYYSYINRYIQNELGSLHSAKCLIYSFDFEEISSLQREGDWETATKKMIEAALTLEKAGADLVAICTNTMHLMADAVQEAINIPLIHIVEPVLTEIKHQQITKIGLLGTRFTMEQSFYKEMLMGQGIEVIIPQKDDRTLVHNVIFSELCRGEIRRDSKEAYLKIANKLYAEGAEGIILGCTEIPLLINQKDTPIPLFDTTLIHANRIAATALGKN